MRRFFKQLEFVFGGTRSPKGEFGSDRVNKTLAVPPPNLTSPSERPVHHRGRDHGLESQAHELLRSVGAAKLAHEIRVEWNPRLKTCAGRADYREKLISLNPLLLELDPPTDKNFRSPQSAPGNLECKMHSRF